jgi:hypothetical protein
MLVSDARYAAQLLTPSGERLFFDDIGCMLEHEQEHSGALRNAWVRQGGAWIDAATARYAAGAPSPMNYGLVPEADGALDLDGARRTLDAQRREVRR